MLTHRAAPVPADTSRGALPGILADVRRRSFFFAPTKAAGLAADNYRQCLGARLSAGSYTVAARTTDGTAPAWQVRFALRGIGRSGALALRPAADTVARPAVADGHATYQQPGFAVDYDNTEAGVRQTFRLAARPAGQGPVQVQLAVATALHPRLAGDSAVVFSPGRSNAPVLRYASLRAWDAAGHVLPATIRLAADSQALALVVDDANATYPVTIDPLASTAGTTVTGQNVGDAYATSVAMVGDLNADGYGDLAVGAPGYSGGTGAVYVYQGSSTGLQTTSIFTINGDPGTNFGTSVAGAGDFNGDGYGDLLIGAPGFVTSGTAYGAAFLFAGSANFFTNSNLTRVGTTGFPNSRGGTTVAGVGDYDGDGFDDFAYGGPDYDAAGFTDTGSIIVVFGNAGLGMGSITYMNGAAAGYKLGASLSGLGDTNGDGYADLVAGAPGVRSALVVRGSTARTITGANAFYLTPTTGTSAGTSVAGPGDVNGDGYADVLLGAPGDGPTGTVYLFLGSTTLAGTSNETAAFTTDQPGGRFGAAVSGAGDINGDGYADFAAGAPGVGANKGRVYITLGTATISNVTNMPQVIEGETAGDQFGSSLAGGDANGDGYGDVLVGAPAYSSGRGRTYAYYGSPAALVAAPTATLAEPGAAPGNYFGVSTASAGDVNADGYADVLVGAYLADNGKGRAYLYLGSSTGLAATPTALAGPSLGNNSYFGYSLAGAGDVNGDGYADVLVGAFRANGGAGRAYLYLGSSTGLATTPTTFTEPTSAPNNGFGNSLAGAGDVNGDGYSDVLIGAYFGGSGQGRAYFYLGSSTGPATPVAISEPTPASGNNFGGSLAGAGDVNGDGFADVLVGAKGSGGQGRAYLYRGSRNGLVFPASATLAEPTPVSGSNFGGSLASAGDVNADGYADVLVGAQGPDAGTGQGRAYFYLGSSTGLATPTATLAEPGAINGNNFGGSLASAGDVNGDGYSDVLVGAPGALSSSQGRAYAYLGSSTGLATVPSTLTEPGAATGTSFGVSVAGAGDVDGDGYSDVMMGAPLATGQGRAYFWRGNQGVARAGALRLYDTDYTPISASNYGSAQFGIGLTARNPDGRIRARLVWEVVGPGTPFSGTPAITGSTASSGRGAWTSLPASGPASELRALVAKAGRASRVRARLEYASSPLPATPPANGVAGTASRVRYGPWTYVAGQQQGLSAGAATPLPVTLSAFTATLVDPAAVRLAWATATEKNSASFEVERSLDGERFTAIGTVAAAGSSATAHRYALLDANPPRHQATLYYRLRLVDLDGTFAYSPVRTVALAAQAGLALFPNPATGAATLSGAAPGTVVRVFDGLGREVTSATADATGTAALVLPAGLAGGVYVVRAGSKAVRLTVE
ncbi:beta strand repeat-containing protein [Hymenobacter ruricola]|uniref:FG-GAP repeat protein n=1 Tax=Hymenobacter ruricola TaxID=2791023 RepID=A0ABS0I8C3_9BACT|nr:FG-GAP-like repeat-containing protein [Hymenobacter ruricola]MBF9223212.1 FG-GAP repeat protein [Hymenobacter ruricola]